MDLELIIVNQFSDDNDIIIHREEKRLVANISCNWFRNSGYTDTIESFTTKRYTKNGCCQIEFQPRDLVRFGKSLIDFVVPTGLFKKKKYDGDNLVKLIDTIKVIESYDIEHLKSKIINNINYCDNAQEIADVFVKYQHKISALLNCKNNGVIDLSRYTTFYHNKDLKIIIKVICFGISLIEYGHMGLKAFWK